MPATPPNTLCFSGLDPTGGAGIQADIETLAHFGCHCLPIITCLTTQNTSNVLAIEPVAPATLIQQAKAVLNESEVNVFKIGLLGSVEIAEAIHSLLLQYPDTQVVFDPVLRAGGGANLSNDALLHAIRELLIPCSYVVTPNMNELNTLAEVTGDCAAGAEKLLSFGAQHILLTGTHCDAAEVINRLYSQTQSASGQAQKEGSINHQWPRLAGEYHGSGCTLAAALAGALAQGSSIEEASYLAQQFTWRALKQGFQSGQGQLLPYRKLTPQKFAD